MPTQTWHEKLGDLGNILANHRGELSQKEDDIYHARRVGWGVKDSKNPASRGYKLGISTEKLKGMAFATEEKAVVHTLAVLYSHDAHKNQLSTLPKRWQTLVQKRLAEIKAGTNMKSVKGSHKGSGKGYEITPTGLRVRF